jgi:hypothetical protein
VARSDPRLSRALAWLVAISTWGIAVWRATASAQWRGDLSALRDQGLVVVTFGGSVSAVLTQAFQLLPLGPRTHRAAIGSALATALAAWLLYRIGRRMLADARLPEWLTAILAAIAAWCAALGSSWQGEATVGGGAAVALALVLAGIEAAMDIFAAGAMLTPERTRRWLLLALAFGAALAESVLAGAALAASVAVMALTAGRGPPGRVTAAMFALSATAMLLLFAPIALRPLAPRTLADLARALSSIGLGTLPRGTSREAVMSWVTQIGYVELGLASLGLLIGAARERVRPWMSMLIVLPLLDLCWPAPQWLDGSVSPFRPLCVGALAVAAAIGVGELVVFLRSLEIPLARVAAVLAVAFHMTLAAVVCEESSFTADRTDRFAAESWTDQALGVLPRDAAIVVQSPELAWRLWAAQRVQGQRPDVLLVAPPLLLKSSEMMRLSSHGASLAPLLRDLTLTGRASEYSLTQLAQARPLAVELDAAWDRRTLSHVAVDGPWLRFEPEALGASDRPNAGASAVSVQTRVAAHVRAGARRDTVSAELMGRTLKTQTTALSLIGMADATQPLLDELERFLPDDPFTVTARLRLDHALRNHHKGIVELRDLLRF